MTRFADLPVETLEPGDEVELPGGKIVEVERVDYREGRIMAGRYYGPNYVVRWHFGPMLQPPHANAGQRKELGSLVPRDPGEPVRARRVRNPEPAL